MDRKRSPQVVRSQFSTHMATSSELEALVQHVYDTRAQVAQLEAELDDLRGIVALTPPRPAQGPCVSQHPTAQVGNATVRTTPPTVAAAPVAVPAHVVPGAAAGPFHEEALHVPFADKEAAKALGAQWDANGKWWYVPAGTDPEPFLKWRHGARVNLRVPFADKEEAKALGATWDSASRTWYVAKLDTAPFARWMP